MENKEGAIQFYREALKANCENFEAFNRLVSNFLITQGQKEELIRELCFTPESLWLKDYYLSCIRQEVRPSEDHEGIVRRRTYNDGHSSHLGNRSEHDESGTTPPRFLSEALYNEDLPLRQSRDNNTQTAANKGL